MGSGTSSEVKSSQIGLADYPQGLILYAPQVSAKLLLLQFCRQIAKYAGLSKLNWPLG